MGGAMSRCWNREPPGEFTLINILWVLCHQCPCPYSELQLNFASLEYSPKPQVKFLRRSALFWVPKHVESFVHLPKVESLFLYALWKLCTQAPLNLKAKCSKDSSSQWLSLRLSWKTIFMWECPCVISALLMFFWCKDVFSMNACHLFPQCMLVVILLIGKVIGIVMTCACLNIEQGLLFALCFLLPCQRQGFLPSCWSRHFGICFWAVR